MKSQFGSGVPRADPLGDETDNHGEESSRIQVPGMIL